MQFLSRLRIDAYAPNHHIEPGEFVVTAPFICEVFDDFRLIVPQGFITDFASIPCAVRAMPSMDPNGPSRPAAVLHDFLYCAAGHVGLLMSGPWSAWEEDRRRMFRLTRSECDELFYEALLACRGVSRATALSMYLGVRIGGWRYWNERKEGFEPDDFVSPDYFNDEETTPCGA